MILGIDTATRWLGLGLHSGTAVLAESGWKCQNNHTIELTPAIQEMLHRADLTVADLDGIAIAIGPGSYTGLRVGLAVAKGIALANQIPLIGVSTLDIVAASFGPLPGKLVVVAEAGRTRIIAAMYEWKNTHGWQTETTPVIDTWENVLGMVYGRASFTGEIGPEAVKQIRAANKVFHAAPPAASVRRAGYLAEIGWQRLRKKQVDDPATLAPIYLKDPAGQ